MTVVSRNPGGGHHGKTLEFLAGAAVDLVLNETGISVSAHLGHGAWAIVRVAIAISTFQQGRSVTNGGKVAVVSLRQNYPYVVTR